MDTLNMTDTSQDNIEAGALTKRSFLARVTSLGKTEGQGDNSRPGLFMVVAEAAANRILDLTKKSDGTDMADEIFARYSQEVSSAQGIGWKPQSSAKQQVSKLRVAIKLGLLPQVKAMEVLNNVATAQREQRAAQEGKNDYPPFDGLVKVARFQVANPDKQLDKTMIEGLLIKPAKEELDEADKLEKLMKGLTAMGDKSETTAESAEALGEAASTIMSRITALGGSTAMRKQAAKLDATHAQLVALVDVTRERAAKAQSALTPVYGLVKGSAQIVA